jgi:hypothetical protein
MSPHIELVNDWAYFLWEGVDEEEDMMMVTDQEDSDSDMDMEFDLDEYLGELPTLEVIPVGYIEATPPSSDWGDDMLDELPPLEWFADN